MGKRIEKALGKEKGQTSSASNEGQEDDPNRTPEPHVCTGHFATDFSELCQRNSMVIIPPVVLRPKRPPSPEPQKPPDSKEPKGKGKDAKDKNPPPPDPEPEQELDENGEPPEPPPKTYTTKDKFEYFKPCVQVEMDNPDKLDTVTEVIVKGWKIDETMMTVFRLCFVSMEKLHSICFWNCGVTDDTLAMMAEFLPQCPNVKHLTLEGNPLKEESYHLLLKEESLIQNLSLRHNSISDKGAESLGNALGNALKQNTKLLSLNLTGNRITDKGAAHIAGGLRMNRTLLSLSLASNCMGDESAKKFAEVLSRFPLTHDEVVERRKLNSDKGSPDRQKSPPPSRRADSKDRPGSVRSSSHADKGKGGKSAKKKLGFSGHDGGGDGHGHTSRYGRRDDKGREKDDKHDKSKGKKDDKGTKGKDKGGKASVVADAGGKGTTKGKDKKGKEKKGGSAPDQESEVLEVVNPLLEQVDDSIVRGQLWIPGNRVLINLNLARNKITEVGAKSLLLALQYQTSLSNIIKGGGTGLMRLSLAKNQISCDSESLRKLNELMMTKDPFYKPTAPTPDAES